MYRGLKVKITAIVILIALVCGFVPTVTPTGSAAGLIIPIGSTWVDNALYTSNTTFGSGLGPDKAIDGIVTDASRMAYSSETSIISAGAMTTTRYITYAVGTLPKTFNTVSVWIDREILSTGAYLSDLSLQYSDVLDSTLTVQTPTTLALSTDVVNNITDASQTIKKYTTPRLATNITARYVRFAFTYTKYAAVNIASTSIPCPVEINLGFDFDTIIPTGAYTTACKVEPYTSVTGLALYPSNAIDGLLTYASRWAYNSAAWTDGQSETKYVTFDLGTTKTFNEFTFYKTLVATFSLNYCTLQCADAPNAALTDQTPTTLTPNINLGDQFVGTGSGVRIHKYTTPKFPDKTGRFVRIGFNFTAVGAASKSPAMPIEILLGYDTVQVPLDEFVIEQPTARSVFQRNNQNLKDITISGKCSLNTTAIEARVLLMTDAKGTETVWTNIADVNNSNSYTGKLTVQAGGWYQLEVRALKAAEILDIKTVNKIGVGEVFITAGQSNSCNFGAVPTIPKDDRVSAYNQTNNSWQFAIDPQPNLNGAGGGGSGGSAWPTLGDYLATQLDVPIGFISCGKTATKVSQWGTTSTYYANLKAALKTFGENGVRGILWHQGEADSLAATTTEAYQQGLQTIINNSRADAGWNVPWVVALVGYMTASPPENQLQIRQGQMNLVNNIDIFQGADTDDMLGDYRISLTNVHLTEKGLLEHGKRWYNALRKVFSFPILISNPIFSIDGIPKNQLSQGDFNCSIYVKNNKDDAITPSVVVVAYSNKSIKAIRILPISQSVVSGSQGKTLSLTINVPQGCEVLKIFVFESLGELKPYSTPYILHN